MHRDVGLTVAAKGPLLHSCLGRDAEKTDSEYTETFRKNNNEKLMKNTILI